MQLGCIASCMTCRMVYICCASWLTASGSRLLQHWRAPQALHSMRALRKLAVARQSVSVVQVMG